MGAKIMHIVGNRPQFIKLAPLTKELHRRGYGDVIIHTGQHYDSNMSDVFFEELGIEKPIKNLNVGSGSHAEMTAKILLGVERAILEYKPSLVILYGDTNSTMAAALVCSKLGVPIVHVEAGTRCHIKSNPEEVNRIIVDHLSAMLFCPDRQSVKNLAREGITENVYFTGDIMYDTFLQVKGNGTGEILKKHNLKAGNYILMTWHRQENTSSKQRMEKIIALLEKCQIDILYPIHPRTKKMLKEYGLWNRIKQIPVLKMVDPLGYTEMVYLQSHSKLLLTDSGGMSKESAYAGVRCLFMMDAVIWPDLEEIQWLRHVFFDEEKSVKEALKMINEDLGEMKREEMNFYGDGHAAKKIVDILEKAESILKK